MERQISAELKQLKSQLLAMGGLVEEALQEATRLVLQRDSYDLTRLESVEQKINQEHLQIDEACLDVLARHSPVAADLRLVMAIIKINTDLERMGDQAMNIGYNTEHLTRDGGVSVNLDLPRMSELVREMVRKSLDAFMRGDAELAKQVLASDDAVDDLKNQAIRKLVPHMQKEPTQIAAALDLILIARNLERMGDHATNIAEDVIFATTGVDVRHKATLPSNG